MPQTLQSEILVTGDFVLDRHIYKGRRRRYGDRLRPGVMEIEELGGAALVYYLLSSLGGGIASHPGVLINKKRKPVLPRGKHIPAGLKNYTVWGPSAAVGRGDSAGKVWLARDVMGFGSAERGEKKFSWTIPGGLPDKPEVAVLFDAGMGFRESRECWPGDGVLDAARWIVLKTARPVARGALWERLSGEKFKDKLVVVTSAAQLGQTQARITSGLSWDAAVESLLESLAPGGGVESLSICRHLLVVFGAEGGVWFDFAGKKGETLIGPVYEAGAVDGECGNSDTGAAFGALSCVTASIAWRLARVREDENLQAAMEGGLSAVRDLLSNGHGPAGEPGRGFPAKRLAGVIKEASSAYSRALISAKEGMERPLCEVRPAQGRGGPCWSIVQDALRRQGRNCPEPAWELAELVARHGPIALGSLPHLSIGKLMSLDRLEVESLRILRRLILEYKERPSSSCRKPLSIGVFGPPGSGKSFAVKELARSLAGGEGWLEFNLSQFKPGTEDLIGAFHQVRDCVLKHRLPVAFFDEFDSRNYGWLQYLLAPMQDGAFQEGQITHPIGKCIFIFAGGTSETFDSFGPPQDNEEACAAFRLAKGPDFKSRLNGFLDVFGPNRREISNVDKKSGKRAPVPDPCDIFYPVRRAFMVRSEFGCRPGDKLKIDGGLLRALLRVPEYIHGTRSLVRVVEPLKKAYPGFVYRSLLPPRQQLGLHVDADEFLRECRKLPAELPVPELRREGLETAAAAVHETWRGLGKEDGWLKEKDDVEFAALSPFLKDSNRAAAKRMASVLAIIGLKLEPGGNAPEEFDSLRLKIEYNLELLAEEEHNGWMEWHLERGWMFGAEKNRKKKTHPCLKPYTSLPQRERGKDRNSVRRYPDFARAAGMKIVPLEEEKPEDFIRGGGSG